MTDLRSKRKFAGAPASERRRTGSDAVIEVRKLPPHKLAREYVLTTTTTMITVVRNITSYKTRQQREAAKIEIRKKGRNNYYFAWGPDRKVSVRFDFEDS